MIVGAQPKDIRYVATSAATPAKAVDDGMAMQALASRLGASVRASGHAPVASPIPPSLQYKLNQSKGLPIAKLAGERQKARSRLSLLQSTTDDDEEIAPAIADAQSEIDDLTAKIESYRDTPAYTAWSVYWNEDGSAIPYSG